MYCYVGHVSNTIIESRRPGKNSALKGYGYEKSIVKVMEKGLRHDKRHCRLYRKCTRPCIMSAPGPGRCKCATSPQSGILSDCSQCSVELETNLHEDIKIMEKAHPMLIHMLTKPPVPYDLCTSNPISCLLTTVGNARCMFSIVS